MILVDTCIWVDHFRHGDTVLAALLNAGRVICHPFIVGELATGNLGRRTETLRNLRLLPSAVVARDAEVLDFIERQVLYGIGLSYIDVHLLASVRLTPGSVLWTRDKRLGTAAETLSLAVRLGH